VIGAWFKHGVVIPPGPNDNYNGGVLFGGTSNPCTLYDSNPQLISPNPDGKVFKAWFQGANDLYYAESNDARSWTRTANPLMANVGEPRIWLEAGVYYLYAEPNAQDNTNAAISLWTSVDGNNFSLVTSSAISQGSSGDWDADGVYYLGPFYKDGDGVYHATYSTNFEGSAAIGIATSTDLIHWTNGSEPIATQMGGADGHAIGGKFYVWGAGPVAGRTPILMIQSDDLTTWTTPVVVLPPTIVAEGRDGGEGMGPANLIEANGKSYLFYTGSNTGNGGTYQIFVATADQPLSSVVEGEQGMATTFTILGQDDFQRPNEAPLSDGGNWGSVSTAVDAALVDDQAVATDRNFGSRMYWVPAFPADQYSQITLGAGFNSNSFIGPDVRNPNGSANTCYELYVQPTAWVVRKIIAGDATNLATGSGTFAAGDVLLLTVEGNQITAFQNGVQLASVSDSDITTGAASFLIFDSSTPNNSAISDWQGGAVNATSSAASGSGQTAAINAAFSSPLVVNVLDSLGNPLPGVLVTFAAPGSGASGSFSGGDTAVTDAEGNATSSTFTANGTIGSYVVTGTADGLSPVNFNMQNLTPPSGSGGGTGFGAGTLKKRPFEFGFQF
jgi:hypothetical protein